jgi:hypothetical protein
MEGEASGRLEVDLKVRPRRGSTKQRRLRVGEVYCEAAGGKGKVRWCCGSTGLFGREWKGHEWDKGKNFLLHKGPSIFDNTVVKKPTQQKPTNGNEGSRDWVGRERAAGRRVELVVEVPRGAEEKAYCRGFLEAKHGLGVGHPAGRQLMQRVKRREDGAVVAVLIWAASAWHLKDRDE